MTKKNRYPLTLQIQPLRSDIATIHKILIINTTSNAQLLKYIWQLKRNKKNPIIEWKIVRKVFCDAKSNYCVLCLKEKYFIINYPHEDILLNKRSKLISKCRHESKNMLANIGNRNNDSMD